MKAAVIVRRTMLMFFCGIGAVFGLEMKMSFVGGFKIRPQDNCSMLTKPLNIPPFILLMSLRIQDLAPF